MSDIVERLRALADEWHEMCGDIHVPLAEAADEIERLRSLLEWKPIETAPRDGTMIFVYVPGFGLGPLLLYWLDGMWREPANGMGLRPTPTHWRPLGPPPQQGDAG